MTYTCSLMSFNSPPYHTFRLIYVSTIVIPAISYSTFQDSAFQAWTHHTHISNEVNPGVSTFPPCFSSENLNMSRGIFTSSRFCLYRRSFATVLEPVQKCVPTPLVPARADDLSLKYTVFWRPYFLWPITLYMIV